MRNASLFEVLSWVREHGERDALQRLRLRVLPFTVQERLHWDDVRPRTSCSDEYLRIVRQAASEIVGAACPF